MKIGLDIDGVLAEFVDPLQIFRKNVYGVDFPRREITQYALWDAWGVSKEEGVRVLGEFYGTPRFRHLPTIAGAEEGVRALLADGHELSVITSRPQYLGFWTRRWVARNFPELQESVYITNSSGGVTKESICKNLGVGVMIEDSLEFVLRCAAAGINGVLLDSPWNQAELPANVARAYSWQGIVRAIHQLKKY